MDDDSRRWRDDGKRDERIATRRDRERGWDRWEPSHDRDRADDRDRGKRPPARDRRTGAADDGKDKEERRDRDREKEKEPAWMETYVPPPSGGGILGGKGVDGELDGIQAWKKGLKEKERKDKEPDSSPDATTKPPTNPSESSLPAAPEGQLDEIQLFKLMMKREAEKKDSPDQPVNGGTGATVVASSGVAASENSSSGSVAQPKPGPATNGQFSAIVLCNILLSNGLKTYQENKMKVIYLEDAQQLKIASNQMQHNLRLLNTHYTREPRQHFHLRIRGHFFPS